MSEQINADPLGTGYVWDIEGYWKQPNDDKVRVLEKSLLDYVRAYSDLLQKQAKLDAREQVTPEAIEAGAIALNNRIRLTPWERVDDYIRDNLRYKAKTVLEAARKATHE